MSLIVSACCKACFLYWFAALNTDVSPSPFIYPPRTLTKSFCPNLQMATNKYSSYLRTTSSCELVVYSTIVISEYCILAPLKLMWCFHVLSLQAKMNVLQHVMPQVKELYDCLEEDFAPLQLCCKVNKVFEFLNENSENELNIYCKPLEDIAIMRLLKQVRN